MTNDKLVKRIFNSYLFISIISTLTATVGMLVDGIVVGQFLGQECISAFGLASPLIILSAAVAGIFSNGGSAGSSIYIGQGDEQGIRLNFTVTCGGTFFCSLVFTGVLIFFDEGMARLLGAEGSLIPLTADYIRGVGLGMVPTMMTQVIMIYIRLNNGAALSFLSVLCMTACNIALDLYFTNVLGLGMFGMGLATSVSYLVAMLVCCFHFFKKGNIFRLTGLKSAPKELLRVVTIGIPSALNRACMTVRGIALNYLLLSLGGSIAVSALAVQNNVNQIISAVTMGVGMTAAMLTGVFFGERDSKMIEKTLRVSIKTGLTLIVATAAVVIIFARPIVGMFLSGNEAGLELAVRALRFFCLSLPLALVSVALIYFYQCTKNLLMANLICIAHGLAFVAAASFALAPALGTDAVWLSFLLAEILTMLLILLVLRLKLGRWPRSWTDLALLSEDFDPQPERILDVSIAGEMDMVMELSSRIHEFCGKHTSDREKVNRLALCIEELAGNVVSYGKKGNKPLTIDIRVIVSDDGIIFRLRDDGVPFNPIRYDDERASAIGENMGIRIIRGLAKEVRYTHAIGMNNLMIRI